MTEEFLERISTLLGTGERELENLGRALFWSSNPSREDYNKLHKKRGGSGTIYTSEGKYEATKRDCIKRMCGQETYESIYGKESIGQDIHNAS
jgi:hypothetical protein